MNRSNAKHLARWLDLYGDGVPLEFSAFGQDRASNTWRPVTKNHIFDVTKFAYREAPKRLEIWKWVTHKGGMDGFHYMDEKACRAGYPGQQGTAVKFISEDLWSPPRDQ